MALVFVRWRSLRFFLASPSPPPSHRSAPRNGAPSTSTVPMASPSSSDGVPRSGRRPYVGAGGMTREVLVGEEKKEGRPVTPAVLFCVVCLATDQHSSGVCAIVAESTAGASGGADVPRPGGGTAVNTFFLSRVVLRGPTRSLPNPKNSRRFARPSLHAPHRPSPDLSPLPCTHAPHDGARDRVVGVAAACTSARRASGCRDRGLRPLPVRAQEGREVASQPRTAGTCVWGEWWWREERLGRHRVFFFHRPLPSPHTHRKRPCRTAWSATRPPASRLW